MFDFNQTWSKWPGSAPIYVTRLLRGQRSLRGHGVKKIDFHEKLFNSPTLQGIVIKLGGMNCLDILYKSYGVTKMWGVIWGHRGQIKGQILNFVRFRRLRC